MHRHSTTSSPTQSTACALRGALDPLDALVTSHNYQVRVPGSSQPNYSFSTNGGFAGGASLPPNIEMGLRAGQYPNGVIVLDGTHGGTELTRSRPRGTYLLNNLVTYATFPLLGGIVLQWIKESGIADEGAFAIAVFIVFMLANVLIRHPLEELLDGAPGPAAVRDDDVCIGSVDSDAPQRVRTILGVDVPEDAVTVR